MNSPIDMKLVDTIRTTGKVYASLPDRVPILEKLGIPYDQPADNVVISGCQILLNLSRVLRSFTRLLDSKKVSYTMLSTEYCCGNPLYRSALKARDSEALAECRTLSREFIAGNIEQAMKLGARRIIIFCSPCYPIYKHAFPDFDIVFYPAAIRELMGRVAYRGEIDYYPGCYSLHRKLAPVPMDLASADDVLSNIDGLDVHRITGGCCYTPDGLSHMIDGIRTGTLVHICTGCYFQALTKIPGEKGVEVLMLPEFIERVMAQG